MGIGMSELLMILVIVVLVFGTKKLRTLGGDLGSAIKSFRQSMAEGEQDKPNLSEDKTSADSAEPVAKEPAPKT